MTAFHLERLPLIAGLSAAFLGAALGYASGGGAAPALLICGGAVLLLATRALPEYLTALFFFAACAVGLIAPSSVFLSGFTGPAVWLTIAGAVIGSALRHSGLADRLGARLAAWAVGPFPVVLARVAVFGTGLVFLMPTAVGRILLLLPLLEAMSRRAGFEPGSRGAVAIALAGVFGTFFPAMAVLPANVPNNVLAGLMEATGLGAPSFSRYLLLHFPVLGLVKLGLLIAMLGLAYRDEPAVAARPETGRSPFSPIEKRLGLLLGVTVALWATDHWHGVSAAWVGLLASAVCLWPGAGLTPPQPVRQVNLETVFYVAGVVGVGAVVNHAGLDALAGALTASFDWIGAAHPGAAFLTLALVAALLSLVVTVVAVPAVLTPLAGRLSDATGLAPDVLAMTQVVGFSTVFLPFQAPPLAVAVQAGGLPAREAARFCLRLAMLTIVLVWPLDLLWWRALGLLGS